MKTYASKEEVYRDFPIAIKFVLARMVHVRDYAQLFAALPDACKARLAEFPNSVTNYKQEFPTSVGFFVEVAVTGDTGQEIGTQLVLLEHETGWELFIPLATALAMWLGPKIGEKVADKAIDAALATICDFLKNRWNQLIGGGVKIDHVEIRTEKKGIMCIPFSQFDPEQVSCLLRRFSSISDLNECNGECFGGRLVRPSKSSTEALARD
jgi:hypothetical protein